ncbi:MAG: hypothetical protein CFE34_02485 [Rhodobacteraceae bacterium PARR1]|nr:MAG: hypothetical protein CFE34_02485 [Rhodobacteraceae bacterium PARR1]
MDTTEMDFFQFLNLQIAEQRIVEDELDLARLAALVPQLCDALRVTLKDTDAGASALSLAQTVTAEVVRAV